MKDHIQSGILPDVPAHSRYLNFSILPDGVFLSALKVLAAYADGVRIVFVAFGKSFDAFQAILTRMIGENDGRIDAPFPFTTPVTGSYFWCPPRLGGVLNLKCLGLSN